MPAIIKLRADIKFGPVPMQVVHWSDAAKWVLRIGATRVKNEIN